MSTKEKTKWAGIKIPELLALDIDKYLASDDAKRRGIFSRSDYVTRLIATDLYEKKDSELAFKGSQKMIKS